LNHLGIDVGKRICRVALKDESGKILDEFFFGNNSQGILELIKRTQNYRTKIVMQYWNLPVTYG
jgi:hypothetical protein